MSFLKAGSPKFGKRLAALVLTLPVLSAAPFSAEAAKRVNLTVISGNSHHYAPVGAAIKAFMPKVDEILAKTGNYKVSWIKGFGGQIVKVRGELEGVQTGLGDIGVVPGPFHPSKLSLYQIGYVTPFTSADLSTTTAAMSNLLAKYPAMGKQAQRFNQTVLAISGTAENYALWTKTKITRVDQLKGMKIGAVGSNAPWVASVGAVPVMIKGLSTLYSSLKTGIYEGTVLWQQAMAAFKFCEVAPYQLNAGFGAVSNALITVNMDSWKKMPGEIQAAVKKGASAWSAGSDKATLGGAKWGVGVCSKKFGQTTHKLTAAESRAWAFALPNTAQAWAKRQDKAGLPGTKMLKTFMDYMRTNKQVVMRNWDRE
jgi:TRAP-type C4-dicarboxylate transport system substrate-binding protein